MNIWIRSMATGAALAIAVFFLSENLTGKNPGKKYDYQYTIEATPEEPASPFSLAEISEVLEKRLQAAAYKFEIKDSGKQWIRVSLFNIEDSLFSTSILTGNSRVQFRELFNIMEVREMLMAAVEEMQGKEPGPVNTKAVPVKNDSDSKRTGDLAENLEPAVEKEKNNNISLIEFSNPYQTGTGEFFYPPEIGMVKLKDSTAVRMLFNVEKVKHVTPFGLQICYGAFGNDLRKTQNKGDQFLPLYFLKTKGSPDKALLENEDITSATQGFDQYGKVEIYMKFNGYGSRKWATMTRQNMGRPIAIIINNTVISAPTVISAIEDGSSSITGNYTL